MEFLRQVQNDARDTFIDSLTPLSASSVPAEEDICSICISPYDAGWKIDDHVGTPAPDACTHAAVKMPCGHYFGYECIKDWLSQLNTHNCPMCRTSFFPVEETELLARLQAEEFAEYDQLYAQLRIEVEPHREFYALNIQRTILVNIRDGLEEPFMWRRGDWEEREGESEMDFASRMREYVYAHMDDYFDYEIVPDLVDQVLDNSEDEEDDSDDDGSYDGDDEDEVEDGDQNKDRSDGENDVKSTCVDCHDEDPRTERFGLDHSGADNHLCSSDKQASGTCTHTSKDQSNGVKTTIDKIATKATESKLE